jgi:ribosomal protein S18 acetylase RimI-like enzyme
MNEFFTLDRLSKNSKTLLSSVYKSVFMGPPWYEEKICSGALLSENEAGRCKIQYTTLDLPSNFQYARKAGESKGIIGSMDLSRVQKCICGRRLINFYPDYIDQNILIDEATNQEGFIGNFVKVDSNQPLGFGFGYGVPKNNTLSVNFTKIIPLLKQKGVSLDASFYAAELGVISNYRSKGLGNLLTNTLINSVREEGFSFFTLRTKNKFVLNMMSRIFSGQPLSPIFYDPERETPWYAFRLDK